MAHDVFISYSKRDKAVADALCAALEQRRVRCWIAPRDVLAGTNYGGALIDAISGARVMVLVFSASSNTSPQVIREVERSVSKGVAILPFRIEDVPLSKDMEFFIGIPHWLDALTPPVEGHIAELCESVARLLALPDQRGEAPTAGVPADSRGTTPLAPPRRRWPGALLAVAILVLAGGTFLLVGKGAKPVTPAPASAPRAARPDPKKVDELVKELAARYREGRLETRASSDSWSSRPFTLAVMDVKGEADAQLGSSFITLLNGALQSTAGATVVDRELLDRLLAELKLGSSSLANPATALKLGRLFAAGSIVTGTVVPEGGGLVAVLRVIDTETTEILKVFTSKSAAGEAGPELCADLARQIGAWHSSEYPPRGRVVSVTGNQCRVNLGASHGLKKGEHLEVVAETGSGSGGLTVTGEMELLEVGKESSLSALPENCRVKTGAKVRLKL